MCLVGATVCVLSPAAPRAPPPVLVRWPTRAATVTTGGLAAARGPRKNPVAPPAEVVTGLCGNAPGIPTLPGENAVVPPATAVVRKPDPKVRGGDRLALRCDGAVVAALPGCVPITSFGVRWPWGPDRCRAPVGGLLSAFHGTTGTDTTAAPSDPGVWRSKPVSSSLRNTPMPVVDSLDADDCGREPW